MYGIYANIGGILIVNATIYSIHGSYGCWTAGPLDPGYFAPFPWPSRRELVAAVPTPAAASYNSARWTPLATTIVVKWTTCWATTTLRTIGWDFSPIWRNWDSRKHMMQRLETDAIFLCLRLSRCHWNSTLSTKILVSFLACWKAILFRYGSGLLQAHHTADGLRLLLRGTAAASIGRTVLEPYPPKRLWKKNCR